MYRTERNLIFVVVDLCPPLHVLVLFSSVLVHFAPILEGILLMAIG